MPDPESSKNSLNRTTTENRKTDKRLIVTSSWAAKVKKDEKLLDDMIELWNWMDGLKKAASEIPLFHVRQARIHANKFGKENSVTCLPKKMKPHQERAFNNRHKWGSNRWVNMKLRCKYYTENEEIGEHLLKSIPELHEDSTMIQRYHKELLSFDLFSKYADDFGKPLFQMFERAGLQKRSLIINSVIIDSDEDEQSQKSTQKSTQKSSQKSTQKKVRDLFDDAIETSQQKNPSLQNDFSAQFEPPEAFDFYTWDNEDAIRSQVLEKRRTGEFACFQSDMQAGRNYAKQLWDLIPKKGKAEYLNYYKLVRDPFRKYTWLKSQGRSVRHIDLGYSKIVPFRYRSDTWFRKYSALRNVGPASKFGHF